MKLGIECSVITTVVTCFSAVHMLPLVTALSFESQLTEKFIFPEAEPAGETLSVQPKGGFLSVTHN